MMLPHERDRTAIRPVNTLAGMRLVRQTQPTGSRTQSGHEPCSGGNFADAGASDHRHRPALGAIIWLDFDGTTWVGHCDSDWFAGRHGGATQSASVLHVMHAALSDIAGATTGHADTAG